jgi:hypothetical protein
MQQLNIFEDKADLVILEMEKFISKMELQIQKMEDEEPFFIENIAFDWTKTKQDYNVTISKQLSIIDNIVYKLYNLIDNEIELINKTY